MSITHQFTTESKALPAYPLPVAAYAVVASVKHRIHNTDQEHDQAPETKNKTSLKTVIRNYLYSNLCLCRLLFPMTISIPT